MSIRLGTPEVLIFSSAILGYVGHVIPLWIFFSFGILGAVFRAALEYQVQAQKQQHVDESMDSIKAAASELGTIFGLGPGNGQSTH